MEEMKQKDFSKDLIPNNLKSRQSDAINHSDLLMQEILGKKKKKIKQRNKQREWKEINKQTQQS